VRWERLFDDLEAQLEAGDRSELDVEVAERTRAELARVCLVERLRSARGTAVRLQVMGATDLRGVVQRVGPDWVLVRRDLGDEVVVSGPAILTIGGLGVAVATRPGVVESRLGLGHIMRALARDRRIVAVGLRDGSWALGTVGRVGADFVDLAVHGPDEPRRSTGGSLTVPFGGIALMQWG
jgi:hypothetical protein